MLFLKLREPADSPGAKSGPANSGLLVRPTGYNPGSRGDGRHWPGPDVRGFLFRAIRYETTTSSCPDWCLPSPLSI